ncbi:MAG TPA: carbohydrate porin [Opitutaceae bacterium]|nr:carbohydrate porin [Opitutaceae bacterium]
MSVLRPLLLFAVVAAVRALTAEACGQTSTPAATSGAGKKDSGEVSVSAPANTTIGLDLVTEGAAAVRGGQKRGETLYGQAIGHIEWKRPATDGGLGLVAYASAMSLVGNGPSARLLGNYFTATNIEGFDSTRLYSWWLQARQDGWSIRAGALLADEEFTGTTVGGYFINSAFGWPAFISANTVNTGPAFYVAAPGIRWEHTLSRSAGIRIGIYDGDTFDSPEGDPRINRHGWHYDVGGRQGWFVIGELELASPDKATRVKAGAWMHTGRFADVATGATGKPFADALTAARSYAGNYGIYGTIERTLAGESGKPGAIDGYVRAGAAPTDRNTVEWALDAGAAWTGPLPGRPADIASLGFAQATFTPGFAQFRRRTAPDQPAPDFERLIELNYRLKLSDRLSVIPNAQYIWHPGGSTALPSAVALLLRITATF